MNQIMNQKRKRLEGRSRPRVRNTAAASARVGIGENRHDVFERIYREWDDALSKLDVDRLLALYAPDATVESPLIRHLLKTDRGVLHGHDELRELFEELARTQPKTRKFYRKQYFTDGKTLMWEYPRKSPEGEQQDFVEVMEIEDGLINKHRVYWGWFGVRVLERGEQFRNDA
jgi:ketosteroid isomerase-like protein